LEAAQVSEFDVLVLDVMLPKLDGISIVRQLRQKRFGTPILLLTARDTPMTLAGAWMPARTIT